MKYRIITNGKEYKIQYRPGFWPFWFTHQPPPSRYIGYRPIDWSQYRFTTIHEARKGIEDIKQAQKDRKWRAINDKSKGGIVPQKSPALDEWRR